MSEGNVYLCKWKRIEKKYRVWLEKRPSLRAEAASLDQACNKLGDLICGKLGDGEAVLELDPPREGEEQASLVALTWNGVWHSVNEVTREQFIALYKRGVCNECYMGRGGRSDMPLPVGDVSEGDLLGTSLRFANIVLASQRFRSLLTTEEQSAFEWRPVDHRRKTRQQFYELIPKHSAKTVGDREDPPDGWRCHACGYRIFSPGGIAADDLPSPMPKLLPIDERYTLKLAMPRERWMALRGKPGTRSILTRPVIILPRARVLRRPKLRVLSKMDSKAWRRKFLHETR